MFLGDSFLCFCGRVIVNDPPALRRSTEQKREQTGRSFRPASQMPMSECKGGVRPERTNVQVGKAQRPHTRARPVLLLITIEDCLPAECNVAAGSKPGLFGLRVTFHEAGQIAGVPSSDLLFQHSAHRRRRIVLAHIHRSTAHHHSNERYAHRYACHASFHFLSS